MTVGRLDGTPLDFVLVGAITFNAVFKDTKTGSWWRQGTGEAAKGPSKGQALADLSFAQMTLDNWLSIHPDSQILQYDPAFERRYNFINKLMNYEASLPGWHIQEESPIMTGVVVDGLARGYDLNQLEKRRLVMDELGGKTLALVAEPGGCSSVVFDCQLGDQTLTLEMDDDTIKDTNTGSSWDNLGRCVDGKLKGSQLTPVQSYQQNLRSWLDFHEDTLFYNF